MRKLRKLTNLGMAVISFGLALSVLILWIVL